MAKEQRLIDVTPDGCIKKTKRKTNFAKIIVSGTAEKPYYDIMWFDYMDGQYHIGYGSYNLNFVFQWLAECFEVEDNPTVDAVEVVRGQNISPMHPVDEFQCSKCGIILRDWSEVMIDEEELDEQYNEYEFKYCPNCGAKMDGGNDGV